MNIKFHRLNHIQICIPKGEEEKAREFYCGILGLKEIPKPENLLSNGGFWVEIADIQLHIGTEENIYPSKRHPAFEVENIPAVKDYIQKFGLTINEDKPIPDYDRFSFLDYWGNRIELMEKK